MAEHNPFRLPRVNPCPCGLRRSLLEDQSNLHSEEDASVRRSHSSELNGRPPRLTNPVWFDIYDRVGQDQCLRRQMAENELLEIAAREQRLLAVPRHPSCGGARSRSLAKSTSICRARALCRTRGEAQAIASGKAFCHSPIWA